MKRPTFFPSISDDQHTWFWRYGVRTEGLLISYDVLEKIGAARKVNDSVNKVLGFGGKVILDNGAFGKSKITDPLVIFSEQKKRKPDIAIVLDAVSAKLRTTDAERRAIKTTLKNARQVVEVNEGKLKLMAVVQGNEIRSIKYCAKQLDHLKFCFIGIPLSQYSKKRQYESAIMKVTAIKQNVGDNVTLHGLGCGSRTMIALLTYFGVRFFDSSSFYKVALIGSSYEPEQFCSVNKPNSKPECKFCLLKQKPGRNFEEKSKYNLVEILKEIQRCRCAVLENKMRKYLLDVRLTTNAKKDLSHLLVA